MIKETTSINRQINVEVGHGALPIGARIRANTQIILAWIRRKAFSF